jgi:hypothetical protein
MHLGKWLYLSPNKAFSKHKRELGLLRGQFVYAISVFSVQYDIVEDRPLCVLTVHEYIVRNAYIFTTMAPAE